jgi:hypothetical protein
MLLSQAGSSISEGERLSEVNEKKGKELSKVVLE